MEGGDQGLVTTIDDKVVAMSFESSKFESGVNKTLLSLDKLKAALTFKGATKGFDDVNKAAKGIELGHIGHAVDDIRAKLGYMSVAALTIFANIAKQAVQAGAQFAKAFTLDPIISGFQEYAINLNAIQTILANTQASGATLKDVNKALLDLNRYSDKTIYNFAQMAKNIGTFTAAGVDLDTSTQAIKGIANLAALSGSNAEQASTAMYQLSQAIASGKVSLMDWNSVVNAGMGGTVFQRALAQTAEKMGTLEKGAVDLVGPMKNVSIHGESFRNSLAAAPGKDSWLTSKVLTNTLKQFTGDLSDAELAAQGFSKAEIMAIQKQAKTAMLAATQVKTLTGVLDVAKETAQSGWAQTWQLVFGDFGEAKKTFTNLSNTINGFINANADARNKVLGDWKKLGGRTVLITGIKNAFHALIDVIKPIRDAFRDIFPAKTGQDLYDLTVRFRDFTEALKPSPETIDNLRRTFRGLFAALDIVKQIVGGVIGVFVRLLHPVGEAAGGFLGFTGSVGDFIVKIDEALKKGDGLKNFFDGLGDILEKPLEILGKLREALSNLFSGFFSGAFSGQMDDMTGAISPFQKALQTVNEAFDNFIDSLGGADKVIQTVLETFASVAKEIGPALGEAFANMNFEAILAVIRTGLFAGLVLMFKNFFGKGSAITQLTQGFGGGILKNISGSFSALQGSMVAMQQNIKAKTLKEIAIAIALLSASVVALSFVNPERLKSALTAMTVGFGQLLGAMAILTAVGKTSGFIKIPFIASSLILLAGAILVLSASVVILSMLSWEKLLKGLVGVGVLLAVISAASIPLSANASGMIRAGIGITAMAVGINLLAIAVAILGNMDVSTLAKGLGAIAIALGLIAGAMHIMPKGMVLQAAALILIAGAIGMLAGAVALFGTMSWETIAKGMGSIAAALLIIAGAMRLMPTNMVLQAAGLVLIAIALQGIARAVGVMGGMSAEEIAKGLGTLAGALLILAGAMQIMQGAIGGAVALGIVAGGIALLVPALVALGSLSWQSIIKGLVALAAAFVIIGAAGLLLTPAVPALLGLGVALLLIGAGLALAGAGIALIGIGLSAIAVAGPTAVGILVAAFKELVQGLTENAKLLVLGLLEVVQAFADTAPEFAEAIVKIIGTMLEAIIQLVPRLVVLINILIKAFLGILAANQDKIIQAGFDLLLALLEGIRNNIGPIVDVAVEIINNFIDGIIKNMNTILAAGVKLIVAFLKGISNNLGKVVSGAIEVLTKFLSGIANNLSKVATAGLSVVTKFLKAISNNLGKIVRAGTDLIVNLIKGIGNAGPRLVTAAVNAMTKFIHAISQNAVKLADEGAQAIINFLNGVADVIEEREPEMIAAGARIGVALVAGLAQAVRDGWGNFKDALLSLLPGPLKKFAGKLGLNSPSKVFYKFGEQIVQGLANGMTESKPVADKAAVTMADGVISTFEDVLEITSPSKVMKRIGRDVMRGFAQGLSDAKSQADVNKAFSQMNIRINKQLAESRKIIAHNRAELKKDNLSADARKEAKDLIKANQEIVKAMLAGSKKLTAGLGEKGALLAKAKEYHDAAVKLQQTRDLIANLKAERASLIESTIAQFSALPEMITKDAEGWKIDAVAQYTQSLRDQAAAVKKYKETLATLRGLGLDDATYRQLLEQGTAGQEFADALVAAGPEAIAGIDTLNDDLLAESTELANNSAVALYDAGIAAAEGLATGLVADLKKIDDAIDTISARMIKRLKKALGIKSPSKEFAELGIFSMEGMAKGFSDGTKLVTDSVDQAAEDALQAMKQAMDAGISDAMELDPTITPVLDLTQVESEAARLATLMKLNAGVSSGQAARISSEHTLTQAEKMAAIAAAASVTFEQNNYSPEALSEVEIYRQTRNQLSKLKSVLALT
jgi:tape measure domain-containing protein